jgi:hypothetical protein
MAICASIKPHVYPWDWDGHSNSNCIHDPYTHYIYQSLLNDSLQDWQSSAQVMPWQNQLPTASKHGIVLWIRKIGVHHQA